MVANKIRVLSFNVAKNFLLVDSLLNLCVNEFDILFLQEPAWHMICMALSTVSCEGDEVVGAPRHQSWTMMVRPPPPGQNPRVYGLCFHQVGQFTACHEARLSRPPRPPPGFLVWPRPDLQFPQCL